MPQNFTIYAGDDTTLGVTVTDGDGNPVDITGAFITWIAQRSEASPPPPVLDKDSNSGNGITITDGPNGLFEVDITDTDSSPLQGLYWHKSVVTLTDDTSTVLTGVLTVLAVGGITTDTSYASFAEVDAFHGARNNVDWNQSDPVDKEAWLLEAMDYMEATYEWQGVRSSTAQPLDWPRYGFYVDGVYINGTPQAIKDAQSLLADYARTGALLPDQSRGGDVKMEKVDVIEVEYFEGASSNRTYPQVDRMLAPYAEGAAGGSTVKLRRA